MSKYIEKVENAVLPVIPLRGLVIFPGIPTSFEINNKKSIKALNAASSYNNTVFLSVMEKSSESEEMHLSVTGITAKIKQSLKLPDGNYRVLIDGKSRAEYTELIEGEDFLKAKVLIKNVIVTDNGGIKGEALRREAILAFQDHIKLLPKISPEIVVSVQAITDPGMLADFIASNVLFVTVTNSRYLKKQTRFAALKHLYSFLKTKAVYLNLKRNFMKKFVRKLTKINANTSSRSSSK